jgi:putative transcriptional regulator
MKNNVKHWRKQSALTQAQLAEKMGVSRQTVNAIEKGDYAPSTLLALKLGVILQTEVESLFELNADDW